jgi:IclR family acetate operon transcriptional repressor
MVPIGTLPRGLAVLEALATQSEGCSLAWLSEVTGLPKSVVHRTLATLSELGYVKRSGPSGFYSLTLRLVGLGLRHLANATMAELAAPVLVDLAGKAKQLVRLALADGDSVLWVGKAQGSTSGLRYDADPDHGARIPLDRTATGLAWLSSLEDDRIVRVLATQERKDGGERKSMLTVLQDVAEVRANGWARVHGTNEFGISAMAAPIVDASSGEGIGVVSIAGPSIQLTDGRMDELAYALIQAAHELGELTSHLPVVPSVQAV